MHHRPLPLLNIFVSYAGGPLTEQASQWIARQPVDTSWIWQYRAVYPLLSLTRQAARYSSPAEFVPLHIFVWGVHYVAKDRCQISSVRQRVYNPNVAGDSWGDACNRPLTDPREVPMACCYQRDW
ncbi:hypothetical protein WG66_004771 [Moniliophthora roreri]|nr:hypothetical protein WG66_004771 [Moniliophthora roreri]